jgi:N utilization substance protein A
MLVDERGLDRDRVVAIVCEAVQAAYAKRYPEFNIVVSYNNKSSLVEASIDKEVLAHVEDPNTQITLRKARVISPKVSLGETIRVPFEGTIGRIEIIAARQIIAGKIRELEEGAIYNEYIEKEGKIVTGVIHKKERSGYAVSLGETTAFLPMSCSIPGEPLRVGYSIKVLLKEVLQTARMGYQLILDRASADFVKKLLELEIPEIYEGVVEIKKIVRSPGYKTKVVLASNNKDIDPVGTCVGVGGVRIKPILKGLGQEKVDLLVWTENPTEFVRLSLKPAVIDEVRFSDDGSSAVVTMAEDQRAFAIGKGGQNIALASALTGVHISLERIDEDNSIEDPFAASSSNKGDEPCDDDDIL